MKEKDRQPIDPLEELERQQRAIRDASAAEIERIQTLRENESRKRHPLNESLARLRLLVDKIRRVSARRPLVEMKKAEFDEKMDALLTSENPLHLVSVSQIAQPWPELAYAERTLSEIDRWLDRKMVELAEARKETKGLAKSLGLEDLLDADLFD